MQTTLIISTYNWPGALNLCLKSVLNQLVKPDEIIIADDGSTIETKQLINSFKRTSDVPVKHIWQKDEGFRLARIRNLAIKNSIGDYLIFIDGDIILHKKFVCSHIKNSQKNQFIIGSRVLLSEKLSRKSIKRGTIKFTFLTGGIKNRLNAIHSSLLSKIFSKTEGNYLNVRGCNMSFYKNDLFLVNGFDEQFVGWGREDSDVVARLMKTGKKKLKLKFNAIQFHLYHNENTRECLAENNKILEETIRQGRTKAKIGLHEEQQ